MLKKGAFAALALTVSCFLTSGCIQPESAPTSTNESGLESVETPDDPTTDPNIGKCNPPPDPPFCDEQADCFRDLCTDSKCIDQVCIHISRAEGLNCIGAPTANPEDIFFGVCECGKCQDQ
jgi:hypothetical protein